MEEGGDDAFPSIRREFLDIVLEELLQTRRSYPRERVVFCPQASLVSHRSTEEPTVLTLTNALAEQIE